MPSNLKVIAQDLQELIKSPQWFSLSQEKNIKAIEELFGPLGSYKALINRNYTTSVELMDSYIELCQSIQEVELVIELTKIIQKRINAVN